MMMGRKFFPPRPGEPVSLICLNCKKIFVGPNPEGWSILGDLLNKSKKAKCPSCGSKKVVRNPWVLY